MKTIKTTLLFIIKNGRILLAEKKRGFGKGKLNGVGGKLELDESVEHAMIRETKEEINVVPVDYSLNAIIEFNEFVKGNPEKVVMHVYVANDFVGELCESDEMIPSWFDLEDIPFDRMFPDDKLWLPLILDGKKILGYFKFDENFNMLAHELTETNFNLH